MSSESHWATKRPIPFANVSGETIPAFAVMAITGVVVENGIALLACDKPGTTFGREYAVNNIFDVPADLRGTCFRTGEVRVLYDAGEPDIGEGWGPKPGQWSLSKGFPGLAVQGIVHSAHRIAKALCEPITNVLVKTTASVAAAATTTSYRIWGGTFGAETNLGFTTVPAAINRSGNRMDSGAWALLVQVNNGWELRQAEQPEVWPATAAATIGPGNTGNVTLSTGAVVLARNWSPTVTISSGDKVLAWREPTGIGLYYVMKSGWLRLFRANLNGALDAGDALATIDSIEALDQGSEPTITSAANLFNLWGGDNAPCLIAESPGLSYPYTLVQVAQVRLPRWFKAGIAGSMTHGSNPANVTTTAALDGGDHPGSVSANNPYGLAGLNGSACLIVENLNESPTQYELVQIYHVVKQIVADVDWDSPDLTKTKQEIICMHEADPQAPEIILTADSVEVVDGITYSGGVASYTTKNLLVLSDEGAGDSQEIFLTTSVYVTQGVFVSGLNLYQHFGPLTVFWPAPLPNIGLIAPGELCQEEEATTASVEAYTYPLALYPDTAAAAAVAYPMDGALAASAAFY